MKFDTYCVKQDICSHFRIPFSGILMWALIVLVVLKIISIWKDNFINLHVDTLECSEYETQNGTIEEECSTKSVWYIR